MQKLLPAKRATAIKIRERAEALAEAETAAAAEQNSGMSVGNGDLKKLVWAI